MSEDDDNNPVRRTGRRTADDVQEIETGEEYSPEDEKQRYIRKHDLIPLEDIDVPDGWSGGELSANRFDDLYGKRRFQHDAGLDVRYSIPFGGQVTLSKTVVPDNSIRKRRRPSEPIAIATYESDANAVEQCVDMMETVNDRGPERVAAVELTDRAEFTVNGLLFGEGSSDEQSDDD
jgi:hypothetical protein